MPLPPLFIRRIAETFGTAQVEELLHALSMEPSVSIRLNNAKPHGRIQPTVELAGSVPWCSEGVYLHSRPSFIADPHLHTGRYYVQEASSMFVTHVLRQLVDHPVMMLDMCAAPGGKSTAARSVLPAGSLLVCNEPVHKRASVLLENMLKWGHPDVIVTQSMPEEMARCGPLFDVVLCDVPCSGEGMFRKEPTAIEQWSPQYVTECARLQRHIVAQAWQCLRQGGLMIYSTCTFNTEENEDNLLWMTQTLGAEVLNIDIDQQWHISPSPVSGYPFAVYRFLPHLTRGEGLFMAAMRKGGKEHAAKLTRQILPATGKTTCWLNHGERFVVQSTSTCQYAMTPAFLPILNTLRQHTRVLSAGIPLATMKAGNAIPHQALAMSTEINLEQWPCCEVDHSEAFTYLRGEALHLPANTPRGYVLLMYDGAPLGFVKNVGSRANNLYPQAWRVRKQFA